MQIEGQTPHLTDQSLRHESLEPVLNDDIFQKIISLLIQANDSHRFVLTISLTCRRWNQILETNPAIYFARALFQIDKKMPPAGFIDQGQLAFTPQELTLIDRVHKLRPKNFQRFLNSPSPLFKPDGLFCSLLNHCQWSIEGVQNSQNPAIRWIAKQQFEIIQFFSGMTSYPLYFSLPKKIKLSEEKAQKLYLGGSSLLLNAYLNGNHALDFNLLSSFDQPKLSFKIARYYNQPIFRCIPRMLPIDEITAKRHRIFILTAIQENGLALQLADESLKQNKAIVLAAIQQEGEALGFADASLKKDKDIVLAAVQQYGTALEYADANLQQDKEIVLAAVQQNGLALQYADASLQKEKDIVLAAVQQAGLALEYADASLKQNKAIVLAAVQQDGLALEHAYESLKQNKAIVLTAVQQNGWALQYADKNLQKDTDIVLAAVQQHGWALQYADKNLQKDTDIVLAAVQQNGLALQFANARLQQDKEIVLAAVQQDGKALQFADASLKQDKVIVLTAVQQNGKALAFADASLKQDKDILLAIINSGQELLGLGINQSFIQQELENLFLADSQSLPLSSNKNSVKRKREVEETISDSEEQMDTTENQQTQPRNESNTDKRPLKRHKT